MEALLEVRDLRKHFEIKSDGLGEPKAVLKAVDGVSFDVHSGEVLGIVGESGCGKSTLGKTLLRLHPKTSGSVRYQGRDIFALGSREITALRARMQMVFQDPFSSLNPRKKIRSIVAQPLRLHRVGSGTEIRRRVAELMQEVGLSPEQGSRYPHQFSGGQRQRIGIARALALNPELLVCDEAVSALDVSIQAQILNLLLDLREQHKLTYVFIAHDLSVVQFISTRILVMYLGRIVEQADRATLEAERLHPYTRALFEAYPSPDPARKRTERVVMGDVPSPINPPSGCHFHPRCPHVMDKCRIAYPALKETRPGHHVACHLY
jgi:peptide/nickel transport system ATP-binding protein/oligopeptide transport system ATP-binding protein